MTTDASARTGPVELRLPAKSELRRGSGRGSGPVLPRAALSGPVLVLVLTVAAASAQNPAPDASRLTVERVFATEEFRGEPVPSVKWLDDGGYTTFEPAKAQKETGDIVRFDAAGKRDVLVGADKLVPPNSKEPLAVQ